MRKVTTTVAAALVAFSFAACNKTNNSVTPEQGGNTYGKVVVEENATNRDVFGGEKNDVSGQGAESAVTTGRLYTGFTHYLTLTDLNFAASDGIESKWETKPFRYDGLTGRDIPAGLVLNGRFSIDDFGADKEVGIAKLADLTKKDGFAMSSVTTQMLNIKPGVTKDAVAKGNNEFSFAVERITAKVQVSKVATIDQGKIKGTFSNFRYAVAGSAKTSYIFADHAGDRDMGDNDMYDNFKSAIHTLAGTTFETDAKGVKTVKVARDLQKVSDKSLTTLATDAKWANYNSLELKEDANYKTASNAEGIYFLENSFDLAPTTAPRQLLYNDIVYVKIYATYVPADKEVLKLAADGKTLVGATAAEVAANNNGTFFRGNVKEYTLYLTAAAAMADGNSKAYQYYKGRMYWRVPANKQVLLNNFTAYADTRRNNIYSLQVTDIHGLGGNYDPIDPKDPNIPAPGEKDGDGDSTPQNPDEPTPDPEDPVDESDNYINVKVQVMQYNLVHRGLKLSRN